MAHRVDRTVAMKGTDCTLKWTVVMLYTDRAKILFRTWSIFLSWVVCTVSQHCSACNKVTGPMWEA